MGSKTVMMNTKTTEIAVDDLTRGKPTATLGIQSDTAFSEASKRLTGRDLCSIADLTVQEMAAIMELSHAVKNHPSRRLLFAPASPSRPPSTHSAATPSSSTRPSPHLGSASPSPTWPTTSSAG